MMTLGELLRGARLGWHWCDGLGGFLRVSDSRAGVVIDLRPGHALPGSVSRDDPDFRCWWEGPAEAAVVAAVRPLLYGGLTGGRVRRVVRLVLDDDGRPAGELTR